MCFNYLKNKFWKFSSLPLIFADELRIEGGRQHNDLFGVDAHHPVQRYVEQGVGADWARSLKYGPYQKKSLIERDFRAILRERTHGNSWLSGANSGPKTSAMMSTESFSFSSFFPAISGS